MHVVRLIIMLGIVTGAVSAHAIAPYIPKLNTTLSSGEPCFYAAKPEDITNYGKGEALVVKEVMLQFNATRITQLQKQKPNFSGDPQQCIKFSQLFPASIVTPPQAEIRYELTIITQRESGKNPEPSPNEAEVLKQLNIPDLPYQPGFAGSFCLTKDLQIQTGIPKCSE